MVSAQNLPTRQMTSHALSLYVPLPPNLKKALRYINTTNTRANLMNRLQMIVNFLCRAQLRIASSSLLALRELKYIFAKHITGPN
jgi:hypothetical protein